MSLPRAGLWAAVASPLSPRLTRAKGCRHGVASLPGVHMRLLSALLCTLILVHAASAEDNLAFTSLQGIAIAQAPEAGVGICFGEDAADTISCAQTKCMDESGLGLEDCAVDLWCFPHRWVADIFMQHQEGIHWHNFVCDAMDRPELEALVATKCDSDWLIECSIVQMWDDDGNAVALEMTE